MGAVLLSLMCYAQICQCCEDMIGTIGWRDSFDGYKDLPFCPFCKLSKCIYLCMSSCMYWRTYMPDVSKFGVCEVCM